MATTFAFDVYGTLINTHGVLSLLENMIGDKAQNFSNTWREKQLEYSFRRGLMQNYVPFSVCTKQALDYACLAHKTPLSDDQKQQLLEQYKILPAFDDVKKGLEQLKAQNYRLFAFSNGAADAVNTLLETAGIIDYFEGVVSADDMKTFKPNPGVYSHFLREANSTGANTWLISSNPFDITGAISHGMRGAWIKRSEDSIFDPWEIQPTTIATDLVDLKAKLVS
ncbi:2-haloacid dehalogenase [Pseudoalteromonas sp. BSi20480]|jgi:2-haloacid dehalogenase|nr:haloacid dehalogenase type II [Pseudoalteromonas sp. BSi20480]GAA75893.1 2-haloacid dehalogenase [Pseudoalteromonas sp. BSi20480]|tara:strand:+ start:3756 stop:4427 length:672 start_codon:yes stop_codon:yes gene_type:complete